MKCVFILATCVLVAATTLGTATAVQVDPKVREIFNTCQRENHVTEQEVDALIQSGFEPANATNNVKCHLKCCIEKMGMFKNNQPVESAVVDFFSKLPDQKMKADDVKKTLGTCKAEKGADECDTAYKILYCFAKAGIPFYKQ